MVLRRDIIVSGLAVVNDGLDRSTTGDIKLYARPTADAKRNMEGRHTNYGYSGYFLASIHDGGEWRALKFNRLVSYDDRFYEFSEKSGDVRVYLIKLIATWKGKLAIYDPADKGYRINSLEI